jgi:hypothetical protein
MDVRKLTGLFFRAAAKGSLVLLGSSVVLAGDRAHEQPTRPHRSAACSPNWGFNQTCWSRFPPVPECPASNCDYLNAEDGYGNYNSAETLQGQQNGMMTHEQQLVSPAQDFSNSPISVYPNASPIASDEKPDDAAAEPPAGDGQQVPDPNVSPDPASSNTKPTLPPLPTPPLPAPDQSFMHPNKMGPNRQMMERHVSVPMSTFETGGRYVTADRSIMPAPTSAVVASDSYISPLVSNHQSPSTASVGSRYGTARLVQKMPTISGMPIPQPTRTKLHGHAMISGGYAASPSPFSPVSQNQVLSNMATRSSYRSANAMPKVYNPGHAFLNSTQLPSTSVYQTMPSEPLRSTP